MSTTRRQSVRSINGLSRAFVHPDHWCRQEGAQLPQWPDKEFLLKSVAAPAQ